MGDYDRNVDIQSQQPPPDAVPQESWSAHLRDSRLRLRRKPFPKWSARLRDSRLRLRRKPFPKDAGEFTPVAEAPPVQVQQEDHHLPCPSSESGVTESLTTPVFGPPYPNIRDLPDTYQRFLFQQLREGTRNFSNENLIDSGASGCVYECTLVDDQQDGNETIKLAVKVLSKEPASDQTVQYHKEIGSLSNLDEHENIIELIQYGRGEISRGSGFVPYMVYPFLPSSLHKALHGNGEPLSADERLTIAIGIARALEYVHSKGIVHGDVKPRNILIDAKNKPKVSDFGCAHAISKTPKETELRGTNWYMDPVFMKSSIAERCNDVYSFGVVLLELMTGKPAESVWKSNSKPDLDRCFRDEKWRLRAERVRLLAISCLKVDEYKQRPTMRKIRKELECVKHPLCIKHPFRHLSNLMSWLKVKFRS